MADPLAPYKQHGVRFSRTSGSDAVGDCPWCASRPGSSSRGVGKFLARTDGEVWRCVTCPGQGNVQGFLREVAVRNAQAAQVSNLRRLANNRGGLDVRTLRAWGVGTSGDGFTYPAFILQEDGSPAVADVRRYKPGGKPYSTSGGHAGLMTACKAGAPALTGSRVVWLCEGEWDGMALWRALREAGIQDDVFAVPGATTLPQKAVGFLSGKDVVLLYDNDHAGKAGTERAWSKLAGYAASLRRIVWPEGLPDGYDIRDLWMEVRDGKRLHLSIVEKLTGDAPEGIVKAGVQAQVASAQDKIDPDAEGASPRDTLKAYRKWLEIDQPDMLDVVFGTVLANRMDIDPLWLFVVAPPGGGKSEILMSLSACPMVHCSTGLTSHTLISGFNFGGADPSLLPKLLGRTWIVKDFTTVLALNQLARDEIFSVLRDAYDGRVEKPFGNGVMRRYEGRFGIVAGVTGKIDSVTTQNAVLGERFIRWRSRHRGKVMVGSDVIMKAMENLTGETEMREDLRKAARKVLDREVRREHYPKIPRWFMERTKELAQWVASMRGVVERDRYAGSTSVIMAKPSVEVATRLAKQFCTLGLGIGVYRKLKELDESVYQIIAGVGRDTCPDRAEEITRSLYSFGGSGTSREIANDCRFPVETVRWVLQDMELLGLAKKEKGTDGRYRLAEAIETLLKRLKLYDGDRAWKHAPKEGE